MEISRFKCMSSVVRATMPVVCALFLLSVCSTAGAGSSNTSQQTADGTAQAANASTAVSGQTGPTGSEQASSASTNAVGNSAGSGKDPLGKFTESVRKLDAAKLNLSLPAVATDKTGKMMGTPRTKIPSVQRGEAPDATASDNENEEQSDSSWTNRSNAYGRDRGLSTVGTGNAGGTSTAYSARGSASVSSGSMGKTSAPRAGQPATSGGWKPTGR